MRRRTFLRGAVAAVAIGLAPAFLNKTRLDLAAEPASFNLFDRFVADVEDSSFDFDRMTMRAVIYDPDSGSTICWTELGNRTVQIGRQALDVEFGPPDLV